MNKRFDDALNECFDRLINGDSIQACLKDHPEFAAELEPLLKTAITTLQATDIQPRPEFRQRAAWEFRKAAQNLKSRHAEHSRFVLHIKWLIPVCAVFAVLVAGTGTVLAASYSLPDQPLYGVKLLTENARLAMTTSTAGKAQLNAAFADERVNEIVKMADSGKVAQVERATNLLNRNLAEIVKLTGSSDETREATTTDASGPAPESTFTAAPAPDNKTAIVPIITNPEPNTPAATTPPESSTPEDTRTPNPPMTIASTPQLTQKPTPLIGPIIIATPTQTQVQPPAAITQPLATSETATEKATDSAKTASDITSANATAFKNVPKPTATLNQADKDRLQTAMQQQAEKNNAKLNEALKRVPDSARPSLEKAINDANKGYNNALKNFSGNTTNRR